MKKLRLFLLAGLACMALTACEKDNEEETPDRVKTFGKFVMADTQLFRGEGKVVLDFDGANSKLLYENGDYVKINGEDFQLTKSGSGASTVWTANGTELTASKFYCAYVDGVNTGSVLTNFDGGGTYRFNLNTRLSQATNKILLGGVTDSNVLTLRPACAIIRLMANASYSDVKIGFDATKILKEGTMTINASEVTLSGSSYLAAVTNATGTGADLLSMEYNSEGGYWYVAVPVSGSVTTTLYLQWTVGGNVVRQKTSGQVTLTKGYVYDMGTERHSPFNVDGTSKCFFKVKNGMTGYVSFSPGNLQAKVVMIGGVHTEWRFAPTQYSYIGDNNVTNIIEPGLYYDLFGFGTSDWSGSGAAYYNSWSADDLTENYIQQSLVGSYANADWGVYNGPSIMYGSVASGTTWRTLTSTEWNYLLNNASRSGKGAFATVNGVPGVILLPDLNANSLSWVYEDEVEDGPSFTAGYTSYSTNVYSLSEWSKLEAAGVIFLPATGFRYGPEDDPMFSYEVTGYYWSSTYYGSHLANALKFTGSEVSIVQTNNSISNGYSVRLVHQQW